ncbi:alpha-D-ribose 1-methylphosphonate 5-triphosphate diphosphatase [Rhodocista pekingensis]|uniref:Alpha-D-ribose 1-methylphosphonate 5-triphosphate diphosphatase n=1 Tax=Rhodocista pekingensis TaxID=201185 RepID=A0ABW2KYI0_9PROT
MSDSVSDTMILGNARLVLADAVVPGSVAVAGGRIAAIDGDRRIPPGALDLEGDLLLPGLVEIHTDNLEKHLTPRPGVVWPAFSAVLAHDAQVAAAGITTVLDALCIGAGPGRDWAGIAAAAIPGLAAAREAGHLRADHLLHLRCEVTDPDLPSLFEAHAGEPAVRLVSVMDHTPGQRQFADLTKFRRYQEAFGASEAEVDAAIDQSRERQARHAARHRALLADACRARGIPVASHDDETPEHVAEAKALGFVISEFPTTAAAATAAREHGLLTVLGAPNVVRGQSHSGNVSALELARSGLLDMLSSDYMPASLMQAVFRLAGDAGITLPAAVATVSRTPARVLGLDDRGEIAPGLRADLVQVRETAHGPVVRRVWSRGRRVL